MANNDELFQQFINDFNKLDLTSLDELYSQFHDIYAQHIVCLDFGCEHITKARFDQFDDQRYKCHNHDCKRTTLTLKRNALMYYSKSSKQQRLIFLNIYFMMKQSKQL